MPPFNTHSSGPESVPSGINPDFVDSRDSDFLDSIPGQDDREFFVRETIFSKMRRVSSRLIGVMKPGKSKAEKAEIERLKAENEKLKEQQRHLEEMVKINDEIATTSPMGLGVQNPDTQRETGKVEGSSFKPILSTPEALNHDKEAQRKIEALEKKIQSLAIAYEDSTKVVVDLVEKNQLLAHELEEEREKSKMHVKTVDILVGENNEGSISQQSGQEETKNIQELPVLTEEVPHLSGANLMVENAPRRDVVSLAKDDAQFEDIYDMPDELEKTFSENVKEYASLARQRIKEAGPHMLDWYKRQSTTVKLGISGALIGASMIGAATGSGAIVAGAWAGKLALRGVGSYLAGETVEKVLRARIGRKQPEVEKLSRRQERELKDTKYATMVAVFALGSYAEFFGFTSGDEASKVVEAVAPPVDIVPLPEIAPLPIPDIAVDSIGPTLEHVVNVTPGKTLTDIMLSDGISEILRPEELAKMSAQGKQNFILNVISQLTPDQLKDIGISSGSKDILKIGETVDVKKLASFAKDMAVTTKEGKVSLLMRALGLS